MSPNFHGSSLHFSCKFKRSEARKTTIGVLNLVTVPVSEVSVFLLLLI